MSAALSRRRFSVAEYYFMGEAGILKPDERTELIEGEIVVMPPIGPARAEGNDRTSDSFRDRFRGWEAVRNENPIRLSDFSQPEPDLALLRPRDDFYRGGTARPEDVLLVPPVTVQRNIFATECAAGLSATVAVTATGQGPLVETLTFYPQMGQTPVQTFQQNANPPTTFTMPR